MRILYCSWNENCYTDTLNNLKQIAEDVIVMQRDVKEYLDMRAAAEVAEKMSMGVDVVFSYDFIPLVSQMAGLKNKIYVSWVYDWPNYTLFSPQVYNKCNRIYIFERDAISILRKYRVDNLYYLPLAVDTERLDAMLTDNKPEKYDVSFVGNFYLKKNEAMFSENIPPYYSGFVDALSNAQQMVFGYNFINEIVDEEFSDRYLAEAGVKLHCMNAPKHYAMSNQINKLVTGQERRRLLKMASESFCVDLFTQSGLNDKNLMEDMPAVRIHPGVDYCNEMPYIFRNSKINLNITMRSITSGVPLRVFDILGSGGFCLSNYQAGIMEHFENGVDLVMYESPKDMMDKIEYYLSHDDERIRIAQAGHEKVKKYSYKKAFNEMFGNLGEG